MAPQLQETGAKSVIELKSTMALDALPSLKIADNLHKTQRASSHFRPDRHFSVYNA